MLGFQIIVFPDGICRPQRDHSFLLVDECGQSVISAAQQLRIRCITPFTPLTMQRQNYTRRTYYFWRRREGKKEAKIYRRRLERTVFKKKEKIAVGNEKTPTSEPINDNA